MPVRALALPLTESRDTIPPCEVEGGAELEFEGFPAGIRERHRRREMVGGR
jgi:hypothetical protein